MESYPLPFLLPNSMGNLKMSKHRRRLLAVYNSAPSMTWRTTFRCLLARACIKTLCNFHLLVSIGILVSSLFRLFTSMMFLCYRSLSFIRVSCCLVPSLLVSFHDIKPPVPYIFLMLLKLFVLVPPPSQSVHVLPPGRPSYIPLSARLHRDTSKTGVFSIV